MLVDAKADIAAVNGDGHTVLMLASRWGRADDVRYVLSTSREQILLRESPET